MKFVNRARREGLELLRPNSLVVLSDCCYATVVTLLICPSPGGLGHVPDLLRVGLFDLSRFALEGSAAPPLLLACTG